MMVRGFKIASTLLLGGTVVMSNLGCALNRCSTATGPCGERTHLLAGIRDFHPFKSRCYKEGCRTTTNVTGTYTTTASTDLPPNAVPGECYAKVFVPPKTEMVTERVCVKEASERVEIIPATYEWVEEKVCVREASKEIVEIPAQYEWVDQTLVVNPGHTDWVRENGNNCKTPNGAQPVSDVFCLVSFPPITQTVKVQKLLKPAGCQEIVHAAEFQTVRREKLVCPAQTRRIPIPAEFDTVQRTVKVADGYMQWQRVMCDIQQNADTYNQVKSALTAAGYNVSPTDGVMTADDWVALKEFQQDNGLAVGPLTFDTMNKLGIQNTGVIDNNTAITTHTTVNNQYMLTKDRVNP